MSRPAEYLDRLIERGLHGNNRADAAKILIYQRCEALIDAGKLKPIPPYDSGGAKK